MLVSFSSLSLISLSALYSEFFILVLILNLECLGIFEVFTLVVKLVLLGELFDLFKVLFNVLFNELFPSLLSILLIKLLLSLEIILPIWGNTVFLFNFSLENIDIISFFSRP